MNKVRLSIRLLLLVALFLHAGCVTYRAPEPPPTPVKTISYVVPQPVGIYHQVESGQTLWSISRNYGVSVSRLMKYNRIKTPQSLPRGSRIFIPSEKGALPIVPLYVSKPINWRYILIHHSATDVGSAEAFTKGHKRRGFTRGLGYHFVIDNGTAGTDDGDIEVGRRWFYQIAGAHCNAQGMNRKAIGICLVGNFDNERVSRKQLDSLIALVDSLRRIYKIPIDNIKGHADIPGEATQCPGRNFPWAQFKRELTHRSLSY